MQQFSTWRVALVMGIGVTILLALPACAGAEEGDGRITPDRGAGRFTPCPASPNCVSTQAPADDAQHYMEPIPMGDDAATAKTRILTIINRMPRTTVTQNDADYLRVEFRSRVFRFVDDVEFYFDEAAARIDFRSASRLGYSDMGVNRKRMAEITELYTTGN
ncbi:MAG: DUF1499 domain-containing protein [Caldilineaceae bacterium]|nr:DUF1499 domain-containing protein [Caldilineaceae bacterium]